MFNIHKLNLSQRQNENQTEYNPESASDSFCIPPSLWNLFTPLYKNESFLLGYSSIRSRTM